MGVVQEKKKLSLAYHSGTCSGTGEGERDETGKAPTEEKKKRSYFLNYQSQNERKEELWEKMRLKKLPGTMFGLKTPTKRKSKKKKRTTSCPKKEVQRREEV